MYELGLLDEFLKQPHQEVRELRGVINDHAVPIADLKIACAANSSTLLLPQWDFLNFFHLCY